MLRVPNSHTGLLALQEECFLHLQVVTPPLPADLLGGPQDQYKKSRNASNVAKRKAANTYDELSGRIFQLTGDIFRSGVLDILKI